MKTADNVSGVDIRGRRIKQENIIEMFIFALILIFLMSTRSSQHLLFHTTAELFTCGISFGLFLTTLYISKMNENQSLERFGQVDKTLTRNREGSGIGLSLVKTLVEMHGGKMSLEGKGTEVKIELPAKLVEEEAAVVSEVDGNIERIHIEFSDIYSNE